LQTLATIRISVLLEASSITGFAKAVRVCADEASCPASGWGRAETSFAVFTHIRADHDNRLTRAKRPPGYASEAISERHTFSFAVSRRVSTMLSGPHRVSLGQTPSSHTFSHGKCVCPDAPGELRLITAILQSHCESSAITNWTERK